MNLSIAVDWADHVQLKRLSEVPSDDLIELMNHPDVRRHLPLARGRFDVQSCAQFVDAKERMWREHGYGPWAIMIDGAFAGWGGVQPENDETDIGLVLHPRFWGAGRRLYECFIRYAFDRLGVESITMLLPESRRRVGGVMRMGFRAEGTVVLDDEQFVRYRLRAADRGKARDRPKHSSSPSHHCERLSDLDVR